MAKQAKHQLTVADLQQLAVESRPSYLPAVTAESAINQIDQRGAGLPILSLNNDKFTLLEGDNVIREFKSQDNELVFYFLHIHFTTQRRAYDGEWDEDNPQDPICMSDNDIRPLEGVIEIQSEDGTCKNCWRSGKETARRDKCSYMRNSIILIQGDGPDDEPIIARLRLNGNTLYGEESRSEGVFNAESVVREFKRIKAELYYHPVVAFFDTTSKNARNKLQFEVLYNDFPSEELYQFIIDQAAENDYVEMTTLTVRSDDDVESEQQAGEESEPQAPSQRGKKKAAGRSTKKTASRSKRGAKKDTGSDDTAGADTPTRSRRSGKKAADTGGNSAAESDDGGAASESSGGDGAEQSSDAGNANPLEDAGIADLIGNVELP